MLEFDLGVQLDPVVKVIAHVHYETVDIKLVISALLEVTVDFTIATQFKFAGRFGEHRQVALFALQQGNFVYQLLELFITHLGHSNTCRHQCHCN